MCRLVPAARLFPSRGSLPPAGRLLVACCRHLTAPHSSATSLLVVTATASPPLDLHGLLLRLRKPFAGVLCYSVTLAAVVLPNLWPLHHLAASQHLTASASPHTCWLFLVAFLDVFSWPRVSAQCFKCAGGCAWPPHTHLQPVSAVLLPLHGFPAPAGPLLTSSWALCVCLSLCC